MIRFTQDSLADYFTLAGPENSWFTEDTNIYDFVDRTSDDLVVTVGDSWTHGSCLAPDPLASPDRRDLVFGNLLSLKLGADWLNLAIPAQGNFWIAKMVNQLATVAPKLRYKNILVICTFTDVTRWFNTWLDQDIDYIAWFRDCVRTASDFDKLLVMLNDRCVHNILQALQYHSSIRLLVGTNFVDQIGLDRLPPQNLLPVPWYQVMGLRDVGDVYTCMYYSRIDQAIEFLHRGLHNDFKSWILQLMDRGDRRITLLQKNPNFSKCHPLAMGHQAWADYIYTAL